MRLQSAASIEWHSIQTWSYLLGCFLGDQLDRTSALPLAVPSQTLLRHPSERIWMQHQKIPQCLDGVVSFKENTKSKKNAEPKESRSNQEKLIKTEQKFHLTNCPADCLSIWLAGWLTNCLTDWLAIWFTGSLTVCLSGWMTGKMIDWVIEWCLNWRQQQQQLYSTPTEHYSWNDKTYGIKRCIGFLK